MWNHFAIMKFNTSFSKSDLFIREKKQRWHILFELSGKERENKRVKYVYSGQKLPWSLDYYLITQLLRKHVNHENVASVFPEKWWIRCYCCPFWYNIPSRKVAIPYLCYVAMCYKVPSVVAVTYLGLKMLVGIVHLINMQ